MIGKPRHNRNTLDAQPMIPGACAVDRQLSTLLEMSGAVMSPCDEAPVFLLALGWGSGSTLIQRVLMTDPSLLVWGEPYGRMGLLTSLTAALTAVTDKWPRERFFESLAGDARVTNFVANHYPPPVDLLESYRLMMLRMYAESARQRGFDRWGIKEVRLCAADAVVLAALFPKARFVVLVRNPYHCYRSSQDMTTRWRYDAIVDSAQRFGQLWADMAATWLDPPKGLDYTMIRYEDVVEGVYDFRVLEQFTGLHLDEVQALSVKNGERGARRTLGTRDMKIIRKLAGPVMKALGYTP